MNGVLPFSADQFFAVFAAYNAAVWPAPLVAYGLGIADVLALAYLWRQGDRRVNGFVVISLALMWAWTGVAYHLLFFSAINGAAFAFGLAFAAEAVVLAVVGVARGGLGFSGPRPEEAAFGGFFVLYAMVFYPLIGAWTGHAYPEAPVFGITPCPVTIFTFGLLLFTNGRVPWSVVVLPAIWALIGGSAAVLLGVVQDWMLPLSGLATIVLLARRQDVSASAPSTSK